LIGVDRKQILLPTVYQYMVLLYNAFGTGTVSVERLSLYFSNNV